jgi:hypothetical protein
VSDAALLGEVSVIGGRDAVSARWCLTRHRDEGGARRRGDEGAGTGGVRHGTGTRAGRGGVETREQARAVSDTAQGRGGGVRRGAGSRRQTAVSDTQAVGRRVSDGALLGAVSVIGGRGAAACAGVRHGTGTRAERGGVRRGVGTRRGAAASGRCLTSSGVGGWRKTAFGGLETGGAPQGLP